MNESNEMFIWNMEAHKLRRIDSLKIAKVDAELLLDGSLDIGATLPSGMPMASDRMELGLDESCQRLLFMHWNIV